MDDRHGLRIGDAITEIRFKAFEVLRDAALADALGDGGAFAAKFAGGVVAEEVGAIGIGQSDFHSGAVLAQALGDAGERSACSHRGDETIDLAVKLLPDFRRG